MFLTSNFSLQFRLTDEAHLLAKTGDNSGCVRTQASQIGRQTFHRAPSGWHNSQSLCCAVRFWFTAARSAGIARANAFPVSTE